tara:strand:- start:417 stop:971 length:555 start_codon:yes stop_codon:yes gene_type:complete
MKYILGLDISTSCTGFSIFNTEGNLVELGYIRLNPKESVFSRVTEVSKSIVELDKRFNIEKTFIEENLQAFRPGLSSAKTLLTLARFNGMVSYQVYNTTGKDPIYVNVNTARKLIGLKINRKSEKSTKEQVYEWVINDLKITDTKVKWPFKILKSGPRKGIEILDNAAYDMSDAYVICKAGMSL